MISMEHDIKARVTGNSSSLCTLLTTAAVIVLAAYVAFTPNACASPLPLRHNSTTDIVNAGSLGLNAGLALEYQLIRHTTNSKAVATANYLIRFYSERHGYLVRQITVAVGRKMPSNVVVQKCDILRLGYDQLFVCTRSPQATAFLFNWNGVHCRMVYRSAPLAWVRCVQNESKNWAICECSNASQGYSSLGRGTYYLDAAGELVWRFLIASHHELRPNAPCGGGIVCTSIALNPNRTELAVGGPHNQIRLYDRPFYKLRAAFSIPVTSSDYGICGLAFNHDGATLVGGGLGLETIVYNTRLNATVATATYPTIHLWNGNFNSVVFCGHTDDVICGDGTVYNTHSRRTIGKVPATQLLASVPRSGLMGCVDTLDNTISLYGAMIHGKLRKKMNDAPLPDVANAYLRLCFSRDGSVLVGATWRDVTIWNVPKLSIRSHILAHCTAIAISPHGRLLAIAVANRIDLFTTRHMRLVRSATLGFRITTGLAFLPNERELLSAAGNRIYTWRIPEMTSAGVIRN